MRSLVLVTALLIPACAAQEAPPVSSPAVSAPASDGPAPSAVAPPASDAPPPDRCGATEAGPFTNEPITLDGRTLTPAQIKATLLANLQPSTSHGGVAVCSYLVYGSGPKQLYLEALCEEVVVKDGRVAIASGRRTPAVMDLDATGAPSGVRTPRDGSLYGKDLNVLFPPDAQQAMKTRFNLRELERALNAEAACRLGVSPP
ncbi:hypothetical protein [Polyangium sp. 6x1]|uniref:hypothetical protein n=1 Tax=Polyangium sp. 6x1 TaxID=3042689 RepID=UPI002482955B|nr:hypothetical protein [Polyangium sp. 6x1]MDI1445911.1 hypothetical protein [Polyangium sp. 6x1]